MTTAPTPMASVEALESRHRRVDRCVIVRSPDGTETRVRWRLGRPEPWRCDEHGSMARAACSHTLAAGIRLADALLGVAPVHFANPPSDPAKERT